MRPWRRRYTLAIEPVARALAAHLLRGYDVDVLERGAVIQFLRRRYMRLVAEYGFPPAMCNPVADRAWELVKQAQSRPIVDQRTGFSFYD